MNQLTDEELLESLAFDFRFHYALGIQDIEKERVCINTLTNFRKRLLQYEIKTGQDLLQPLTGYRINTRI
ncbi:transposase [Aneurinibacillus sp. Ricciae_BoGa-3]|uniref:transposase n=1 Tax=Aneurinibacillus sp. Ricciae_BoGa-3 TaxID=3022697 RepID=UPI003FA4CAC0